MNIRLLRKIAELIVEKPKEFNMAYWHVNPEISACALSELPKGKRISCETAHCIAGWAQALSSDRQSKINASDDAQRILKITPSQAKRLFYVDGWPEKFRGKQDDWNPTPKQTAKRIEHFIQTEGQE